MVRGGYGAGRTITGKLRVNRATEPMQAITKAKAAPPLPGASRNLLTQPCGSGKNTNQRSLQIAQNLISASI